MIKYLNNFADLKSKKKIIKFNINNNIKNIINTSPLPTNENSEKNFPIPSIMEKAPLSFGDKYKNKFEGETIYQTDYVEKEITDNGNDCWC